jgi:tripartite-type tricarboxylate transporter receptor subunit TctC
MISSCAIALDDIRVITLIRNQKAAPAPTGPPNGRYLKVKQSIQPIEIGPEATARQHKLAHYGADLWPNGYCFVNRKDSYMRPVIAFATALFAIALSVHDARSQSSYPDRPITWIIPFGPGNVTDVGGRVFAKALSEKIGQPIIVENKPGAAGIIGTEFVAHAKPDGYTMLYGTSGPLVTHALLYKKLSYSPVESFALVNGVTKSNLVLFINASLPYKTAQEFIDYLKKNPGKVNVGSSGSGTGAHLSAQLFQFATDTTMTHVPYKNTANLYTDLFSGVIDVLFDYTVTMRPHIEAGKVIPLAVTSPQRLPSLPNVPTFTELGYDVVMQPWSAIVMPIGTTPGIVSKMSAAVAAASKDPAYVKFQLEHDNTSIVHLGPDALVDLIKSETQKFKILIEKSGITAD